jgi:hypothetical protein
MMQTCMQGLGCPFMLAARAVFCPVLRVLVACSAAVLARPLRWDADLITACRPDEKAI